jgi:alkanesulfonate monooxygenase SsuD/methylene tetrahydromethanopterin reductase-like flavin-dependent oxidoreductase (luciferase family)
MRFGVGFFSCQRPPGSRRTQAELHADVIAHARAAEEAGLDSFWLSDHHYAEDGYLSAPLILAAQVLSATSNLVVATGDLVASIHNPLRLAEELAALDLGSGGRFIAGLGYGYRKEELVGLEGGWDEDPTRVDEIVAILRRAFSGEEFSFEGRHHKLPRIRVTPPPATPGGPRLALLDADPARAARLDLLPIIDPALSLAEVEERARAYDEALPGGRESELVLMAYGFVWNAGEPWRQLRPGFTYMRDTYDRWQGKTIPERRDPSGYRLLLGSSEEVAAQVSDLRRRLGPRLHLVLRLGYPGMDPGLVSQAIGLWGDVADQVRADV